MWLSTVASTQAIGVKLVNLADEGKRVSTGALKAHGHEQALILEEIEETLEEFSDIVRGHAPLPRELTKCGLSAIAEPLDDERSRFRVRTFGLGPAQLGSDGTTQLRQISLLDLEISVHPVLGEDLLLGVVEDPLAPQEVEEICYPGYHIARRATNTAYGQTRYRLYGQTQDGRYLFVVLDRASGRAFYPVTARDMTARERKRYRRR